MPKEPRIFNSEVATQSMLQLHRKENTQDEHTDKAVPSDPKKDNFHPELIARLTERIKKL